MDQPRQAQVSGEAHEEVAGLLDMLGALTTALKYGAKVAGQAVMVGKGDQDASMIPSSEQLADARASIKKHLRKIVVKANRALNHGAKHRADADAATKKAEQDAKSKHHPAPSQHDGDEKVKYGAVQHAKATVEVKGKIAGKAAKERVQAKSLYRLGKDSHGNTYLRRGNGPDKKFVIDPSDVGKL